MEYREQADPRAAAAPREATPRGRCRAAAVPWQPARARAVAPGSGRPPIPDRRRCEGRRGLRRDARRMPACAASRAARPAWSCSYSYSLRRRETLRCRCRLQRVLPRLSSQQVVQPILERVMFEKECVSLRANPVPRGCIRKVAFDLFDRMIVIVVPGAMLTVDEQLT